MPLLLRKLTVLLAVLEEVQSLRSGVSTSEAAHAVLHRVLRSLVTESLGSTRKSLVLGHKGDEGTGVHFIRGKAKRAWAIQSGEEDVCGLIDIYKNT